MENEKCCARCKWGEHVGGDWVPYGLGFHMAMTPKHTVCTCPHWDKLDDDPCEVTDDGKDCKYFEDEQ